MYAFVDLGLPSGTKWATRNVGARSQYNIGKYFSWGETETKKDYTWETYAWGGPRTFTKYTGSDGYETLESSDDAATVNMGAEWHTPTKEQVSELIHNTITASTTVNDVAGVSFTSLSNSANTIFIPFTGVMSEEGYTEPSNTIYLLTSSLDGEVLFFSFDTGIVYDTYINRCLRYCGFPVRGVIDE